MFRMPKFTIAGLLWLTVAVALGFAISQGPAPEGQDGFLGQFIVDTRWQAAIQATGSILLVFVLLSHVRQLTTVATSTSNAAAFGLQLRRAICVLLAASLAILALVRLLLVREIIDSPIRPDSIQLWEDLWPDILFTIVSIAGVRLFLQDGPNTPTPSIGRTILNSLVLLAAWAFGAWMLTDRTMIAALVHIATSHIEAAQPGWLHREGVFPHHAMEGYWSFWMSAAASMSVFLGGVVLVLDSRWLHEQTRTALRCALVAIILSLAVFAWWFTYSEFPRISPDMASTGSPRHWSDSLAWGLLWLGLAFALAYLSSQSRHENAVSNFITRDVSFLATASTLIGISMCWYMFDTISVAFELSDLFSGIGFFEFGELIAGVLVWPEFILRVLLLVSCIALLWQRFRRPDAMLPIPAISPSEFAYQFIAWGALIAVGVPALWAFSFCYWLGPLVLWF